MSNSNPKSLNGTGIDQPLQTDSPSGSMSYLQDHLGSTSQLVDTLNASRKAHYDYTSYGQLEGDSKNPVNANPFTYTGREDDGTGLMYYRARYYDPDLEVFISQDPLGDKQRYVGGNPLIYNDPFGLRSLTVFYGNDTGGFQEQVYSHIIAPTSDYISASNPKDLGNKLQNYVNNLGNEPFDNLNIYSHGSPTSLGEGSDDNLSKFPGSPGHPGDIDKALRPLKNRPPKKINLYACKTGQEHPGGNIAQEFKKYLPGATVIAPTTDLNLRPFSAIPHNGGQFKKF